jgi:general L-amino acid transport system permease protein
MFTIKNHRTRGVVYQIALVLGLLALLLWLAHNTWVHLQERGIHSGFDFLFDTAGFVIGESMFAFDSQQSYAVAFLVGLLNTVRVSVIGIVCATTLGLLLGLGRLSNNALARTLCYAYVELFRNIPLLLHLLMWYVLLVEVMPDSDNAWHLGRGLLLSKEGLALPWLGAEGITLTPEFVALTWGLTLYTSAFVSEVIRSGILSVAKGQIEAAQSIGLSRWQSLRWVILPQAMRVIVPPMTNQYLNLTKNSSLAVAIGYPDLVNITNTALNQTGRAVECIAIVMAVYLSLSLLTSALMNHYNRSIALKGRG